MTDKVDLWGFVLMDSKGQWSIGGSCVETPGMKMAREWNLHECVDFDFWPNRAYLVRFQLPRPIDPQWDEIMLGMEDIVEDSEYIREQSFVDDGKIAIQRFNQADIELVRDLLSQREQELKDGND